MFAGTRFSSLAFNRVNLRPYGFRLSEKLIYLSEERLLINHDKASLVRIQLRQTMANLLLFLLNNADKKFISDDELMEKVWEENELRASTHRLWQVTRDLRHKLIEAGLENDLFCREGRKGFVVNPKGISPLFHSHSVDVDE
ncbi:winged helix-turn-helix domain-containing protein [Serratia fonticola]|uniref:winged helix-turn-helix domain-containing protein n=1 Tax=Serratia fonticola TaxID=47917 RepID=UPI0015C5AD94|nr:winged helix-turn-helix domain-containing protein [Serratia fonticola]MBC3382209.1 winged helix-turn-helix domain-containing protein [Serratia fonticola]NYA41408.1 winged helix-turn-helix domain-containing protein [Serratia fonticola]